MLPIDLLSALRTARVLGIVRDSDPDRALDTVLALAVIGPVEVSLTTVDALRVIERARKRLGPDAALGVGTARTETDVRLATTAGADFVVTPGLNPAVDAARAAGLPVLGGALTASEIEAALIRDVTAVKLFPAGLGGPGYLRALRSPYPDVPFVPVGGIDADTAREHLAAGALAVGVGKPLVGAGPREPGFAERIDRYRALASA